MSGQFRLRRHARRARFVAAERVDEFCDRKLLRQFVDDGVCGLSVHESKSPTAPRAVKPCAGQCVQLRSCGVPSQSRRDPWSIRSPVGRTTFQNGFPTSAFVSGTTRSER
jgi:hypothetical protein